MHLRAGHVPQVIFGEVFVVFECGTRAKGTSYFVIFNNNLV
jgi:hypothetical protein